MTWSLYFSVHRGKNNSNRTRSHFAVKIGKIKFYCNQRGIDTEKAIALIVNGLEKYQQTPIEFAVEAQNDRISPEGSVGYPTTNMLLETIHASRRKRL